jgi:serine/threonine protein kinase
MGSVWAARHVVTGKSIALKFLKRPAASREVVRRFAREARAACAVQHPNVREIYDVLELEDGLPVMVMECLEGESLADRLDREGKLELDEAARILLQVVSAVGTAHALGIVHRDLKPENIFLTEGGHPAVRVLDFGIAKLAPVDGENETHLTATGTMVGTPCYMAPEQVFGERDIDHRIDIWALGLLLYRTLTGVLPTQAENVGQVMKVIVTKSIRPIEEVDATVPDELARLVNRMLSRNRNARPRDLLEVQAVLAKFTDAVVPSFEAPSTALQSSSETAKPAIVPSTPEGSSTFEGPSALDEMSTLEGANTIAARAATAEETAAPDSEIADREEFVIPTTSRRPAFIAAGVAVAALVTWALWAGSVDRPVGGVGPTAGGTASMQSPIVPAEVAHEGPARMTPPAPKTWLAIDPADAAVWVDGHPAEVVDGSVALVGALGAKRRVELRHGKRSTVAEVVITVDGPFPAKVAIDAMIVPTDRKQPAPRPAPPPSGDEKAPPPPPHFKESDQFE